jgi:toxin ParE1/3/4
VRAVVFNARARNDLWDAWEHVAGYSEAAADRLVDRIEDEVYKLRDMPGMGHQRKDVKDRRLLFWTVWPYVIAYRVTRRTLYVVRVIHGSRNFRKIF